MLSETFVVNEARALRRLGHDVEVLAHERPDGVRDGMSDVPVRYRCDDTRGDRIQAILRLTARHPIGVLLDLLARRRWRREEEVPPLRLLAPTFAGLRGPRIHVHFAAASALDALRAQRVLGVPYSLTAHAYDIYARPANLAEKVRGAAFVTTGSEYSARDLRRLRADIHVVVMGVDTDRLRRRRPHPTRRTVLAVGRLVEKKGFIHLIHAAADPRLRGAVDEIRIVGDGRLAGPLAAEIERLDLSGMVTLVGALTPDGVADELERAAVLAVPSVIAADGDRDTMPVVAKEALAMEVPVVASQEVGLPEVVLPAFGRLVTPGDPRALARALAEVLSLDSTERARMGRAGRAHVRVHAELKTETSKLSVLLG